MPTPFKNAGDGSKVIKLKFRKQKSNS